MCLVYRGVQKLTANHLSLTFSVKVTPFSQGPNLTANMPFYFYFTQEIDAAQIQLFAKVVKCMLSGEFPNENYKWVNCTMPKGVLTMQQLQELCDSIKIDSHFYITTPRYAALKYTTMRSIQIPDLEISLNLFALQPQFYAFKVDDIKMAYVDLADCLLGSFVAINTALTIFFINRAEAMQSFNWHDKYGPCFFDRKRFSVVRDRIIGMEMQARNHGGYSSTMGHTAKAILMGLLYQCGFLAFWCCLTDIMSFPGCDENEKEVMENLSSFMLENYANVYVYNTVVENNPLRGGDVALQRGSAENTTRIKLYLTRDDDSPVIIRFDLPHEGCPYVHLNVEENGNNNHIPLSKVVQGDEYDHVFVNLERALLQFNFNTTEYVHSPVAQDRVILKGMRYRTALLNYASCSFYSLAFSDLAIDHEPECVAHPFFVHARDTLIELLETDGYCREELLVLDPPNLLDMAYDKILE